MEIPQSLSLLRNDDLLQSVPPPKKGYKKSGTPFLVHRYLTKLVVKIIQLLVVVIVQLPLSGQRLLHSRPWFCGLLRLLFFRQSGC